MKLYQHDKQTYQDGEVSHTWQFGIINDISLLWVNEYQELLKELEEEEAQLERTIERKLK